METDTQVLSDAEQLQLAEAQAVGKFMKAGGMPLTINPYAIALPILEMSEHHDIRAGDAVIDWLFRAEIKKKQGRFILGTCYQPRVTGDLSDLFDDMLEKLLGRRPDFLIVLSWDYWRDASPREREILCFHELKHCAQARDMFGAPRFNRDTGLPIWAIQGHDIEEFDDVVRRYGIHSNDLERFMRAITDNIEAQ